MVNYYQEDNGDFLAIVTETNGYYQTVFKEDHFEGRATAIAGHVGSVATTSISRQFLRSCCRRVAKSDVPIEWRKAIGY